MMSAFDVLGCFCVWFEGFGRGIGFESKSGCRCCRVENVGLDGRQKLKKRSLLSSEYH